MQGMKITHCGWRRHFLLIPRQTLLAMKLTVILLTAALISVHANVLAQNVTYKSKEVTLEKLFSVIKQQTGFAFFYNDEDLKAAKPVTVDFNNTPLIAALDQSLKNQPVNYSIQGKTIFIAARPVPKPTAAIAIDAAGNAVIDVHGVVKDEAGKPAAGVVVSVKGINKGTTTNENGEFTLTGVDSNAILVFSSVNMETYETKLNGRSDIALVMKAKVSQLEDVAVQVNTGYQTIPKERTTGSLVHIDNAMLNRTTSSNIIDRINGIANGVLFTPGQTPGTTSSSGNKAAITIDGRSTINSNPNPLIVVDNFPYDGDLSNINPNDVESIDILRDAAAASIWGAFSGNGVIVITTKKGKFNQAPRVSFNSNVTIASKPDLYYSPIMSSSDYIAVEQFLYGKGFYTSSISSSSHPALSPVVDILAKRAAGQITAADSAAQINALKGQDIHNDLSKYYYQNQVNQQYALNVEGGGINNKYFFSAGFDKNISSLINNGYSRVTLDAKNTYSFLKNKLEFSAEVIYTQSNTKNNSSNFSTNALYLQLADANGNALAVPTSYRLGYVDTAGQGKLLDWHNKPLDELNAQDNTTRLLDYRLNLSLKYKIIPGLEASVYYYYDNGASANNNYRSQQTFFTRDLINKYSQLNYSTKAVTYKVPLGGILDNRNVNYTTNHIRAQINYTHTWKSVHALNVLAGGEVKGFNSKAANNRLYGYNPDIASSTLVDYVGLYPLFYSTGTALIPNNTSQSFSTNNFISYYGLAAYTYSNRYSLTLSGRKDESNIFGVNANQKGVPLYSAGLGWDISRENFYHVKWLPYLKLKVTDGYQGNVNYSVSSYTTATISNGFNVWGALVGSVSNPPNPSLRWETDNIVNIGIDFATKNNMLSGSLEYFTKKGKDLIGPSLVDPTTGLSSFTGNVANIQTHGVNVALTFRKNIFSQLSYSGSLNFSYVLDKITQYYSSTSTISSYTTTGGQNLKAAGAPFPLVGKPLYSLLAFRWAGLDSVGNPRVLLDGQVSENYAGLSSSTNFDNLKYMGPATPPIFGNFLNTFSWKQFSLSFNILYKFGYYFRRPSIYYTSLFTAYPGGAGNPDWALRWQNPGDEKNTNVPSMIYPANGNRDVTYLNSDILVEKADHIRLQDITVSYDFSKNHFAKFPFQSCKIYLVASNVGILWRANHYGIDPDFVPANGTIGNSFPLPRTIAAGLKIFF